MEVVASLSQGRTAAAQCGLFTHKSVPVIFEPPFMFAVKVTVAGLFQTLAYFYQSMCSDIPADCKLIIQNSGNCRSCHEHFMPDNSSVGRRL